MKLLLATDEYLPHAGGVPRVILETSRRLQARGHDLSILTFERDASLPRHDEIAGVPVGRIPLNGRLSIYPRALVGSWRAFRRYLQDGDYDLLHIHLPLIGLGAVLHGDTGPIPKVYTFYGPWHLEMATELRAKPLRPAVRGFYRLYVGLLCRVLRGWQGRVMRRCDRVIVLSKHSRKEIAASLPAIKPDCVVLIPGGVDVDRFRPVEGKTAVRRRLGLPEEAFLLLTVRRLVPRMGVENLIHAFALLKDQGSTLHLVVGGQGRLMEALRHQAGELGLEASVTYTGFVPEDDLPAYYQAADLFVLPTAALEGFGLPTLEALASGLPVVGTPIGSTTEILTQFDARFLAKGTTATDLAEKIVEASRILQQEDVASRARAFAVAHYRWDSIVDRYEDLYQELCTIKRA